MRVERIQFFLIGLFILLSGALALSYEVIWARKLVPLFGSDAVSVSVVVALFMLGLGLGAHLAGRLGDRLVRPLRLYACFEIGLGTWVVLTPWLIGALASGLVMTGAWIGDSGVLLTLARLVIGALLLLPPTMVMGASLPLLARFAVNVAGRPPSQVLHWYALNLIGAVTGVFLAGFLLLPRFPMSPLLWVAGGLNVALGCLLLALAFWREKPDWIDQPGQMRSAGVRSQAPSAVRWMTMSALVGLASMMCQLAWTRTIVLVVGGSAYAFSAVLGVFLAGLGLGAWLAAACLRFWPQRAIELFVLFALLSITALFASLFMLPVLPAVFLAAFDAGSVDQHLGVFLLQAGTAAALFLVPAMLMGALFPLLLRQMLDEHSATASATARVYLANTLGCVVGALLAGLVLIPAIGITPTLVLAIGLFCYALLLGSRRMRVMRWRIGASFAMLLVFAIGWLTAPPWNSQLMSAGISEYARRLADLPRDSLAEHIADQFELLYYRDGPAATVSVSRERWSVPRHLFISTNGKVDGSSWGDMPTQKLSAHLPILMHNDPRSIAIVGMGTGVTAGSATLHDDVERVTVLEIEPAMVEGARLFSAFNHQVHDHPKASIRVIDGRFHLSLFENRYDVIISEPSNPWIAGVASLFTREFYELGARALKPDGVFAQWIQIYDISPDNLRSVVSTFQEVFPHVHGAVTIVGADLLLIGSQQPIRIDPVEMAARMQAAPVAEDMADDAVGVHSVWDLLARLWMAPPGIEQLSIGGRIQRDDWPFLMYEAPLSRYAGGSRENMALIGGFAEGIDAALARPLSDQDAAELRTSLERYVPRELQWWSDD